MSDNVRKRSLTLLFYCNVFSFSNFKLFTLLSSTVKACINGKFSLYLIPQHKCVSVYDIQYDRVLYWFLAHNHVIPWHSNQSLGVAPTTYNHLNLHLTPLITIYAYDQDNTLVVGFFALLIQCIGLKCNNYHNTYMFMTRSVILVRHPE